MDNRNRSRGWQQDDRDFQDRDNRWHGRQDEQFSAQPRDQFGETSWDRQGRDRWASGNNFDQGYGRNQSYDRGSYQRSGFSDTTSLDDYDRAGTTRYGRAETTHRYFRGDDFGGQDYTRGSYGGYSSTRAGRSYGSGRYSGAGGYGSAAYDRGEGRIPPREYDRDDRGFFDRASDEVMSWFGDDDATRRRQLDHREDHRGRGPANYTRSNERLLEDACERLTRDPGVDASKIDVSAQDNEITLTGTVNSRSAKRRAEDIVDDISGVKHVQNNLRVESRDTYYSETSTLSDS